MFLLSNKHSDVLQIHRKSYTELSSVYLPVHLCCNCLKSTMDNMWVTGSYVYCLFMTPFNQVHIKFCQLISVHAWAIHGRLKEFVFLQTYKGLYQYILVAFGLPMHSCESLYDISATLFWLFQYLRLIFISHLC